MAKAAATSPKPPTVEQTDLQPTGGDNSVFPFYVVFISFLPHRCFLPHLDICNIRVQALENWPFTLRFPEDILLSIN